MYLLFIEKRKITALETEFECSCVQLATAERLLPFRLKQEQYRRRIMCSMLIFQTKLNPDSEMTMSVKQCSAVKLTVDGTLTPERKVAGLRGE